MITEGRADIVWCDQNLSMRQGIGVGLKKRNQQIDFGLPSAAENQGRFLGEPMLKVAGQIGGLLGSFYGAIEFGVAKDEGIVELVLDGDFFHFGVDHADGIELF